VTGATEHIAWVSFNQARSARLIILAKVGALSCQGGGAATPGSSSASGRRRRAGPGHRGVRGRPWTRVVNSFCAHFPLLSFRIRDSVYNYKRVGKCKMTPPPSSSRPRCTCGRVTASCARKMPGHSRACGHQPAAYKGGTVIKHVPTIVYMDNHYMTLYMYRDSGNGPEK
jgi:hypothetical protein